MIPEHAPQLNFTSKFFTPVSKGTNKHINRTEKFRVAKVHPLMREGVGGQVDDKDLSIQSLVFGFGDLASTQISFAFLLF